MNDIKNDELLNTEATNKDFITCFLDLNDIERYKDSSSKMASIESVLFQHLNVLKIGVVSRELSKKHIVNIKKALNKDKLSIYFPNLRDLVEEFFSIIALYEK